MTSTQSHSSVSGLSDSSVVCVCVDVSLWVRFSLCVYITMRVARGLFTFIYPITHTNAHIDSMQTDRGWCICSVCGCFYAAAHSIDSSAAVHRNVDWPIQSSRGRAHGKRRPSSVFFFRRLHTQLSSFRSIAHNTGANARRRRRVEHVFCAVDVDTHKTHQIDFAQSGCADPLVEWKRELRGKWGASRPESSFVWWLAAAAAAAVRKGNGAILRG